MLLPDAYVKIQAYDQIRRRLGEVIGDYIVREQRSFREMTEALQRVRNAREEKDGRYRWQRHTSTRSSVANSDFDFEMVDEEDGRTDPSSRQEPSGQTFFDLEIRAYRLLQNTPSVEKNVRWFWLEREMHGGRSCGYTVAECLG